ncbi:MAG: hypothetical protein IT537_06390 [Hyphomicrobiales bacterium]|nr:hypothetical protein [Hyphomicrobiales bacterium]
MSSEVNQERIVERLRANLRAAGIQVTDADIEGMGERGFLRTVLACEEIAERTPENLIPDYLGSWGDEGQVAAAATGPVSGGASAPGSGNKDGYESIAQVAARLRTGEASPVELTQEAIARIQERDPRLNAIQAVLADQALEAARQAERDIAAGDYRGPLHGVPIGVKDLFAVAGTRTSAGSKILADWVPEADSAVVERLRGAGAIIVAQTRMSEFAYNPSSGNAHYGETRNPWNLEHDTGGSGLTSGAVFGKIAGTSAARAGHN